MLLDQLREAGGFVVAFAKRAFIDLDHFLVERFAQVAAHGDPRFFSENTHVTVEPCFGPLRLLRVTPYWS